MEALRSYLSGNAGDGLVDPSDVVDRCGGDRVSVANALMGDMSTFEQALVEQPALCGAMLAELCKDEDARTALTADGIVMGHVFNALSRESGEGHVVAVTQCLRAIGNLCYENDSARTFVREQGGVDALAKALKCLVEHVDDGSESADGNGSSKSASLVNLPGSPFSAGPGSILNAAGDHGDLQKLLVEAGVVSSLMWLLSKGPTEQERRIAFQALLRCSSEDKALDDMVSESHGGADTIIMLLEQCDSDDDAIEMQSLFQRIATVDKVVDAFATPERAQRVFALACRQDNPVPKVTVIAAVFVSVLLGTDACLAYFWDPTRRDATLQQLQQWCSNADNYDFNVPGLVGIGNISRNDANAKLLGETPHLIEQVVAGVKNKFSFVQHAALGALKNLLMLQDNRLLARDSGVLEALILVINDPQAPLQYLACSTLRVLCSTMDKSFLVEVVDDRALLSRIHHLTKSEVTAARCEAMRLLGAIVKISRDSQIIMPLVEYGVVEAMARMLDESHPMLKVEACVALVILSVIGGPCHHLLLQEKVVEKSLDILKTSSQIELAMNFMTMYAQLSINAIFRPLLPQIISVLEKHYLTHSNDMARANATKVIQHLNARLSSSAQQTQQQQQQQQQQQEK